MTVWVPKGEFPHWENKVAKQSAGWKDSNILAAQTQIRQARVIHFENLYRYMFRYLIDDGWKSTEDGEGDQLEHFYGEHRNQAGEKQVRIWWRSFKAPGGIFGPHGFLRYYLHVDFLTEHLKRIEMVTKGRKIRPYIGDVSIWVTALLMVDYQGWGKKGSANQSSAYALFEEYFVRRIYKDNIRMHEVELRRQATRFVDDTKYFIHMHRPSEIRKPIHADEREFY